MVELSLINEIDHCRICGSCDLLQVIDLGQQCLTGRFPKWNEPDPPTAPLELLRCCECGLVQLRHSVKVSEMFGEGYGYRSGINENMVKHLATLAHEVESRVNLGPGDVVLDIGCNDGTLLKSYMTADLQRAGIDPILNNFKELYPSEWLVHAGFFSAESYAALVPSAKAKAVTSVSMFYDLEDPSSFVADVASILAADGVWVLEQSYLPKMIETNSFDTICHEHLEYYALAQIERLASAAGLRVFDVKLNEINGGSSQIWVCHEEAHYERNSLAIEALVQGEARLSLLSDAPFEAFRTRVARVTSDLRELLVRLKAEGKIVYAYGASTKGNVLLQYTGLDDGLIAGCAERNETKYGCVTPGTRIPIVPEEEARLRADYFLVLPWHFREGFLQREMDWRAKGGKFIFPLPSVEVV